MAERVDVDERNRGEFSGSAMREARRARPWLERNVEQKDRSTERDVEIHIGKASE